MPTFWPDWACISGLHSALSTVAPADSVAAFAAPSAETIWSGRSAWVTTRAVASASVLPLAAGAAGACEEAGADGLASALVSALSEPQAVASSASETAEADRTERRIRVLRTENLPHRVMR